MTDTTKGCKRKRQRQFKAIFWFLEWITYVQRRWWVAGRSSGPWVQTSPRGAKTGVAGESVPKMARRTSRWTCASRWSDRQCVIELIEGKRLEKTERKSEDGNPSER